jgi:hypothetical protein
MFVYVLELRKSEAKRVILEILGPDSFAGDLLWI